MKNSRYQCSGLLLATAATLSCATAWADGVARGASVAVLAPIPYSDAAHVESWVKAECDVPGTISSSLGSELGRRGLGGAATNRADQGWVVRATIERIVGGKAGGWSFHVKSVSATIELLHDGQVERVLRHTAEEKALNPFASTCPYLLKASQTLGEVAADWVEDPTPRNWRSRPVEAPASDPVAASAAQ